MKFSVRVVVTLLAVVMVAGLVFPTIGVRAQDDGGPETCVNTYVVRDGDTLFGISRSFDVNLNELAEANDIENIRLIFIGQALCLDGLAVAREPEDSDEFGTGGPADGGDDTTTPPAAPPTIDVLEDGAVSVRDVEYTTNENGVYIVRGNDRIYNLAFIFGVTPEALTAANDLGNPAVIIPGQELVIPAPTFSSAVPSSFPAIALLPRVARPGESITVFGANYPANTDVNIYAEKFSLNRISEVIATVTTDEDGRFEEEITLPEAFDDDGPLNMRTVSISGRVDGQPNTFGANFFLNLDWLDANNR
jgi:LysM repeat protein